MLTEDWGTCAGCGVLLTRETGRVLDIERWEDLCQACADQRFPPGELPRRDGKAASATSASDGNWPIEIELSALRYGAIPDPQPGMEGIPLGRLPMDDGDDEYQEAAPDGAVLTVEHIREVRDSMATEPPSDEREAAFLLDYVAGRVAWPSVASLAWEWRHLPMPSDPDEVDREAAEWLVRMGWTAADDALWRRAMGRHRLPTSAPAGVYANIQDVWSGMDEALREVERQTDPVGQVLVIGGRPWGRVVIANGDTVTWRRFPWWRRLLWRLGIGRLA